MQEQHYLINYLVKLYRVRFQNGEKSKLIKVDYKISQRIPAILIALYRNLGLSLRKSSLKSFFSTNKSLFFALGDYLNGARWYSIYIPPASYKLTKATRDSWKKESGLLQTSLEKCDNVPVGVSLTKMKVGVVDRPCRTWYYTIATHMTQGLKRLLHSADMAGVRLEVK